MVTVESLCCGTPVVGFEAGGPECIAKKEYSSFMKYGDMNFLIKEVKSFLDKNFDKAIISHESIKIYSKQEMTKQFINIYKQMMTVTCYER